MSETWKYLLIALTVPGLGILFLLAWIALVDGIAKTRRKD